MGFGVRGKGLGVWGLRFGVWGLGSRILGFKIHGVSVIVCGVGFRIQKFWVLGSRGIKATFHSNSPPTVFMINMRGGGEKGMSVKDVGFDIEDFVFRG